ncbi:hypothetical protein AU082_18190 [Yersinia pestis]|nr:hypothetical protein AU082_18190 [Yersinia pestis]
MPASLPLGYHRLILEQDLQQWQCSIIVAPKRCYEPDALLQGKNCGGLAYNCIPCVPSIIGVSVTLVI